MKKKLFFVFVVIALVLGACTTTPSEAEVDAISTSAAATVEARFTAVAATLSVLEPTATVLPTDTPWPTPEEVLSTPTLEAGLGPAPEGCLLATLVSETIPDGTVLATGEYFFKRWYLRNDGECTWNQDYELLYWNGDLMGGYIEYPFTNIALPGETIEIPIQLQAPATPGTYTGYWMLRSKSGYTFGIGPLSVPASVKVDVRDPGNIDYAITSVEYYMVREPEYGCPANVDRTIYAEITTNGPLELRYRFYQRENDGGIVPQRKQWLRFDEAGTKTVKNLWRLNSCVNSQPRFVSLGILSDTDELLYKYPEYVFVNDCPDLCE